MTQIKAAIIAMVATGCLYLFAVVASATLAFTARDEPPRIDPTANVASSGPVTDLRSWPCGFASEPDGSTVWCCTTRCLLAEPTPRIEQSGEPWYCAIVVGDADFHSACITGWTRGAR